MEHKYCVKDIPSSLRLREEFSSQPAPQNWQNEEELCITGTAGDPGPRGTLNKQCSMAGTV